MRRLLAIFGLMAIGVSAWGVTGTVVDNKGKPVAGAKIAIWTFWTFDRTFHTDSKGAFVYMKSSDWDGKVAVQTYKILDANGKPVPNATVIMPWYNQVPLTYRTNKRGQFDYPLPGDTKGTMRILDSAGVRVPRAKAVPSSGLGGPGETTTDANGEYSYPALQKRKVTKRELRVFASASGFAFGGTYFVAGQAKPLVIKLWPEQALKTTIVGENGAPVPGASVCLDELNSGKIAAGDFDAAGYDIMPTPIITPKDGVVALHHLPGGDIAKSANVRLTLFAPGRCKIERIYDLAELRKSGKIVLPRTCTLQGTIHPPGELSLPDNASVCMRLREDYGPPESSEHWVEVDKNGQFAFDKLPPGTATIRLVMSRKRDPGWVLPAVQSLKIQSGQAQKLDLTGTVGAVISGSVRDAATGAPIAIAMLDLQHAGNPDGETSMRDDAITDEAGNYTARVASGKVDIYMAFCFVNHRRVSYKAKDRPRISVQLAEGETKTGLDFKVDPNAGEPETPLPPLE